MSQTNAQVSLTHHALLVVWGQFAQHLGLIQALRGVALHQKTYTHTPHTKVVEFLVAMLAGLPHLKDISLAAHPLDQDQVVAQAWGQPAWADYSGVSRTLQALTMDEAQQMAAVLLTISQPLVDQEVTVALRQQGGLVYDADLTGRPVSNTSTSYPDAAYGYMSDGVHLGYQAALVSLHSPTYGRLWLSVTRHPGDTVACTQAEAVVLAAEARTGVRPRRRTEFVQQRLQDATRQHQTLEAQIATAQHDLATFQREQHEAQQQLVQWQARVTEDEAAYQAAQRPQRPHSRLAQARHRLAACQRRTQRLAQRVAQLQQRLHRLHRQVAEVRAEQTVLADRVARFERENATNPAPIKAVFRLDAGFGSYDNVALLVELGYEVYTKALSHRVTASLRQAVTDDMTWRRVGANAEMVAWTARRLSACPYPLDVALERFHTGDTLSYATLLHYGDDRVTDDLPGWFDQYNARQTIEAGIKEGKQVFQMHHLKVRTTPALFLQEHFAAFAANFVRWAAHWLVTQCAPAPMIGSSDAPPRVKMLVQVAAHTSAWVVWQANGCLVRFTDHSLFAGSSLLINGWAFQPPLPLFRSCDFGPP